MSIDLAVIKKRLEDKRSELQREIAGLTEAHRQPVDSIEASQGPNDFEEVALDLSETVLEQSIQGNEKSLLDAVQSALERIATDTYGICTNCGQPIPDRRLEALPWASLCMRCESKLANQNQG